LRDGVRPTRRAQEWPPWFRCPPGSLLTALRLRLPPRSARRVYWAEDALDDQFLIRHAVNQMGDAPEIAFFEDGAALVQAVEARRPDLLVLDINMPVLNGLDALRRVRAREETRGLPAVLFSTARHERDVAASRELQVLDFVQKPTHFGDFTAAVRRVLAYAAAPDAARPAAVGEARPGPHESPGWLPVARPATPLRE
jgi:two-component system response regulator